MDLLGIALRASACDSTASAFTAVVEALSGESLHFGCWCDAAGRPLHAHPHDIRLAGELLELAAHARRAEGFRLRALSRDLDALYPGAELLLLPVPGVDGGGGGVLLGGPEGSFGGERETWLRVGEALGAVARRQADLAAAREEAEQLRQRVEEVEALDVLGLAANRTLDATEVLNLVARFSRTLLEADYVVVSTGEEGCVRECAAVGLRTQGSEGREDVLARSVMELGRPLHLGPGEAMDVADFPYHHDEGMLTGFGVPLTLFGKILGALMVGYRAPYTVTRRDTRLAVTLARHAAVAIGNAQLHRAVATRSEALELANGRLRELSAAKERFFHTMSHELRTPLNAVKGYSELLMTGVAGELPETAVRYAGRCSAAAQNLLLLVDDLLDLAKLDAGGMSVQREPCSLEEIVEAALASVEPQAAAKGIRLSATCEPVPPLTTDAKRVRQILTNLLSNAVKFTCSGEVRLTAALCEGDGEREDPGTTCLEVRVSDTGPGIAPEHLEMIFQEYEQVPGSEGTGLGLPISRRLARLLDGDLGVESAPGAGSTFILRLPGPLVVCPRGERHAAHAGSSA
jgi:signal transduction histidine kinase